MNQEPNNNVLEAFFLSCFRAQQRGLELFFQAQNAAHDVWANGLPPQVRIPQPNEDFLTNYLEARGLGHNNQVGAPPVAPLAGVLQPPVQPEPALVIPKAEPIEQPQSPAPLQVGEVSASMQDFVGSANGQYSPHRALRTNAWIQSLNNGDMQDRPREPERKIKMEIKEEIIEQEACSSSRVRPRGEEVELGEPSIKKVKTEPKSEEDDF